MMTKKKKPKLDEKAEQSLTELDTVFGSRQDTIKVLLSEYLRGCLPNEVEGHELAKANTLSKLCDMWLLHRKTHKERKREDEVRPTKLSEEAMKHITGLGVLRSDLREDVTNDEAMAITPWNAKWIKIGRWAFEGNLEELAPVAKDVITKYGGAESELAFLDTYIFKATSDPGWTLWTTEHIYWFLMYAQLYLVKHPGKDIKGLCKGKTPLHIEAEIEIGLQHDKSEAEFNYQHLKETRDKIRELKKRKEVRGRLNANEFYELHQAKKNEAYLLEQVRVFEQGMERVRELEGMN